METYGEEWTASYGSQRKLLRSGATFVVTLGVVLGALCCGCQDSMVAPAITASCSQIGAQCQLAGGPLGVCQQIECGAPAEPPCFKCISQH